MRGEPRGQTPHSLGTRFFSSCRVAWFGLAICALAAIVGAQRWNVDLVGSCDMPGDGCDVFVSGDLCRFIRRSDITNCIFWDSAAASPILVADLDDNPGIVFGTVNMDAYKFQALPIYVDVDATGNSDGSSWADAFTDLQDALDAATRGVEIRVAQGVYTPQGPSREATFELIDGVAIMGGYAGDGEPDPDARDIDAYETILSGDLNGNDGPKFANNGENSYHVVAGKWDGLPDPSRFLDRLDSPYGELATRPR